MSLMIHPLDLGTITLDASNLVLFRRPGTKTTIPVYSFLITGGSGPILVDTGYREPQDFESFGMQADRPSARTIVEQLARFDLRPKDIRYVLHTHAHLDHSGATDLFPMSTIAGIARRELEFSVSGTMAGTYAPPQAHHFIDRLYADGALRLFDVDGTYEEEIIPGVAVGLSGGHTPGSVSVFVETDHGMANICGDIFYNTQDSLLTPLLDVHVHEPTVTGNRAMSLVEEKRAIKKALASADFLLPGHDFPLRVESGHVVETLVNGVAGAISAPSVPALSLQEA